jgi:hypothetical protein
MKKERSGDKERNRRDDVNTEATFCMLQGMPEKCHDRLVPFF